MKPNYILVEEVKNNNWGEIYYAFKHIEDGHIVYYITTIGDGFVRSEEISMPEYVAKVASIR